MKYAVISTTTFCDLANCETVVWRLLCPSKDDITFMVTLKKIDCKSPVAPTNHSQLEYLFWDLHIQVISLPCHIGQLGTWTRIVFFLRIRIVAEWLASLYTFFWYVQFLGRKVRGFFRRGVMAWVFLNGSPLKFPAQNGRARARHKPSFCAGQGFAQKMGLVSVIL